MRRRLLLALVGLTAAILIGAVIPLGLRASAHDYAGYLEDAQSRARMAAAAAEEVLADHVSGSELSQDLTAAHQEVTHFLLLDDHANRLTGLGERNQNR